MAKKDQARTLALYVRQAFEDDYVQEQLRNAAAELRTAYGRARKQRTQAASDKRLYRNLRQAATALGKAKAALRPPEPQPKHRLRKLAIVGLAAGATALVTTRLQKQQAQEASAPGVTEPSPAEPPAAATTPPRRQPEAAMRA